MSDSSQGNSIPFKRQEYDLHLDTQYKILYEDDWLIAVDKPSPLPVHAVGSFRERNLLSLLKRAGAPEGASVVNRLDSETSGIVIVAKTPEAAGQLGIQFQRRQVHKEYLAIVLGTLEEKQGRIDLPLGPQISSGHRVFGYDPLGKVCQTDYWVLEEKKEYSLLRLVPLTGRTHQLRAHLAALGHPIAGDKIYINSQIFNLYVNDGWQESMLPVVKVNRLALHASSLRILHPQYKEPLEFVSELPLNLSEFWKAQQGVSREPRAGL